MKNKLLQAIVIIVLLSSAATAIGVAVQETSNVTLPYGGFTRMGKPPLPFETAYPPPDPSEGYPPPGWGYPAPITPQPYVTPTPLLPPTANPDI